jgi:hypothetical protein
MDYLAAIAPATGAAGAYELRFQSLFHSGRALSFPCDEGGSVQWHAMSERARSSFLRARDAVGVEFAQPAVRIQG